MDSSVGDVGVLPTEVVHLMLDSLLGDWLASEDIPGVRRNPDAPTSDREDRPEEACSGEEPDHDEEGVNSKVDRKVRPETRFRLKPLHRAPPQLILAGTSVGLLVDLVLRCHLHRLLSLQRIEIDLMLIVSL